MNGSGLSMNATRDAATDVEASRVTLSSADVKKLMDAALRMQRTGQKNHPKYHQIVTLLRQYQLTHQRQRQAPMQQHVSPAPPSAASGPNQHMFPPFHNALGVAAHPFMKQKVTLFSEKQLEYLHNQIRAYKALCHSMDTAMAQAKHVTSTEPTVAPMDPARTIMEASSQTFPKAEDPPVLELLTPKWTRAARNLVYIGPNYLDGDLLGLEKKSKLAFGPYNLCSPYLGMNDVALKVRYMQTLQHFLTASLEKMEKYTGELSESEQRTLRDLRCVLLQQQLRRHVAKAHMKRLALLGEPCAVDRKSFRRRRPVLRFELHCDEREKRKRSVAREKKRRADHQLYLKAILNHSREFFAYHKNVKAQVSKASKAVKALIDQRASKAEREEDRQEKLRLKALKANDMEAYGKLVAEAKNERLTYLLSQTNSYLDSIRQLIRQHKQKHHVVDEYTTNYDARQQGDKETNSDDVDDDLNYLEIASKGELPRQPLMLLSDEERMLIINRLHQVLRPFLLRRVKASVLDQLPDKVEKVLKCELSGWQKIMYRRIQEGGALLMETTDGSGKKMGKTKYTSKGLSNVLMQLRKVCNHPYLFQTNGYQIDFDIVRSSGKFELLDRMLPKLKAAGHRVLMFSQMTQLMHILEDYFNYRGFRYLRLDGSTSADEREQRMFMFNAPDSPFFIFLLSTRAGGLGLNLATADTVIIFDSDWNPAMDAQAQDRAHRIGQKNEVRVFRLVTNSPVEEKILSRATDKMNMNNLVVEAGKFNNRSKEAERRAMLESLIKMEQEEAAHVAQGDDEAASVLLDDEINEMMALTDEELVLYQRLDLERQRREEEEWKAYCKQYNLVHVPRSRLMSEKDAPSWLREANELMEHEIATGKHEKDALTFHAGFADKPRKRKEMSYRDQFTDAEFVKMCEDGIEDQEMKAASKSPTTTMRGKRKRDEEEEGDDEQGWNEQDAALRRERKMLCYYYRKVYEAVTKLKDPTGRLRSELYVEKPSAMDYPDYYTIVKEPMDLTTIKERLDKHYYASHEQFEEDFNLMVSNAQLYNHPESLVVYDALEIDKCVKAKMKPLHLKTMAQIAAAYEKAKKDHKRRSKNRKEKKRRHR
ncbi:hypothetical protein PsorP6_010837 [Peronosclerospora sorghi]|uniref:Uncharacterized protein n=1 Tax=Peronosclerospora sorghi TaxID=230839 RepID=A0ACC0VWM7_9STRA|nr:hypothetical protein PsorP6_010837 [Peronosclerospora sorghi]